MSAFCQRKETFHWGNKNEMGGRVFILVGGAIRRTQTLSPKERPTVTVFRL
ncbi:MAG: hypothetical protein SLRJCFUN_001336 [Candidatus Fervidibacter sp.]